MSSTNGNEGDHEEIHREALAQDIQALFLVVIDLNGQSRVVLNPDARFTAQRHATSSDVYPSLANCLADYQAIKTAEAILSFQTQIAHQMAAGMESKAEAEATGGQ
jgi:hypothetical protein